MDVHSGPTPLNLSPASEAETEAKAVSNKATAASGLILTLVCILYSEIYGQLDTSMDQTVQLEL